MRNSSILVRSGLVAMLLLPLSSLAQGQGGAGRGSTSELFFSEYVEGSANNKALEIYNPRAEEVDLGSGRYTIRMYFNGSAQPQVTLPLEGVLAPGEAHVFAHAGAATTIVDRAQQTNDAGWFNGDDAIVLFRDETPVDSIGQVGVDPGSQWGRDPQSTSGNTLRRIGCVADWDPSDPFDPREQWSGHPEGAVHGLGAFDCADGDIAAVPEILPIYEVQGSGQASPVDGSIVTVRGVVTGDFQERGELGGFFIQEDGGDGDPATSDGVFVYHFRTSVTLGDLVEVTGLVEENFDLTEITDVGAVTVVGRAELPQPVSVELPLPDAGLWERYEGMLVSLRTAEGPLVVTETYLLGRAGIVTLADEQLVQFTQDNVPDREGLRAHYQDLARRTIFLDDGRAEQNPDPVRFSSTGSELSGRETLRVGDTVSDPTGIITYGHHGWSGSPDAFRLHPTRPVQFVDSNPRPRVPPSVGGSLRVASFNVLNFFNGNGRGGGFPTSRGAYSRLEFERQLAKLVSAMTQLDAHILGVIEIENDAPGPQSAIAELVAALDEESGGNVYDYVETGAIGSDEIKVGLLYQPATVRPVGQYRILDRAIDPRFDDELNRPALAQTFEVVATGARLTVVVNHLKSKGSPCPGDPDGRDGQGNCNGVRTLAAQALVDWAEALGAEAGDPDVLIMGDLNAYMMEDPIRTLLAGGLVSLLEPNEYTYVFDGHAGTLDHAIASESLALQSTDASPWRINAQEPLALDYNTEFKSDRQLESFYEPGPYRSSDHDPVLVGLELSAPPLCEGAAVTALPVPSRDGMVRARLEVGDPEGDPVQVIIVSIEGAGSAAVPAEDVVVGDGAEFSFPTAAVGEGGERRHRVEFVAADPYGSCRGEVYLNVPSE